MDTRVQMPGPLDAASCVEWTRELIERRQTVLPKRLADPGPDAGQLDAILRCAAAAPDHGELVPWRFIVIPAGQRARLADAFAAALLARDAQATPDQLAQVHEKAFRAPLLMLGTVLAGEAGHDIPPHERLLSAGCAIQNMLLMATAMGFGSALTSGKAMGSQALRELFGLRDGEQAVSFISMGTATRAKALRVRPEPERYASFLD
ncbi:MAG: nitroreductase family protein [Ramlibacter sp.]